MTFELSEQVLEQIRVARTQYNRLVIIAGPLRSGKTSALQSLSEEHGWPLVNINLTLSEKLLELTVKQRALRVAQIVDDIVREQAGDTVLLDNIEMLFHPDLQQDPFHLLQKLSRNRTIVTTWRGAYRDASLTYAAFDHAEFQRIENPQALIISTGKTLAQEHSA